MIRRDEVDEELKRILELGCRCEVGMSDVPSPTPTTPYIILEWSPSPQPAGSMGSPQGMPYFDYLVKSVGRDHKETARTSSVARSVITGQRYGGQYEYQFVKLPGIQTISRLIISQGIIVAAASPELFEVNDIYRICLTGSSRVP